MGSFLSSPMRALGVGLAISVAIIVIWAVFSPVDRIGFTSFLLRWLHVFSGMIWVGMIWFVNFIQLSAVAEAEPPARAGIMKLVVPRVATTFRHFSHLTIISGVLLVSRSPVQAKT